MTLGVGEGATRGGVEGRPQPRDQRQAAHARRAADEANAILPFHRVDPVDSVTADEQQAGALRPQQPLVAARRVRVAAEGPDVDVDTAEGLRAVDDAQRATLPGERRDVGDRHPDAGRRDHVADADHAGRGRDGFLDPAKHRSRIGLGGRNRHGVEGNAVATRAIAPAVAAALVLHAGHQHAIAALEPNRQGDRVHRVGGAAREEDLVGLASEQPGRAVANPVGGDVDAAGAVRHAHRVPLELVPRRQHGLEDHAAGRPERGRV